MSCIEVQQGAVQDSHILGLDALLLCTEQVVLLGQEFYGILHAQIELFVYHIKADSAAFQFALGCIILLLGVCGIQPEAFYIFVKLLLNRMNSYIAENGKSSMGAVVEQIQQTYDLQVNGYYSRGSEIY